MVGLRAANMVAMMAGAMADTTVVSGAVAKVAKRIGGTVEMSASGKVAEMAEKNFVMMVE